MVALHKFSDSMGTKNIFMMTPMAGTQPGWYEIYFFFTARMEERILYC